MIVQELFTKLGFKVDPSGIEKGKDTLGKFKSFIGKLALGAGVAMIGRAAIKSAAEMESLNAQFKTMLGSVEAADAMMGDIVSFASATPFGIADLAGGAAQMLNFGVASEKIMPTLQMLGDVAGANTDRFKSLSLVYGQIASTGRLMGQDLLQLINSGFNPLQVISKATGRSMADLKKDMEDGKISAKAVELAFQMATSEGGMFFGNLKAQSETFTGVWSTMADNIRISLMGLVIPLMPVIKDVIRSIGQIDFTPIVDEFQGLALATGDFLPVLVELAGHLVNIIAGAARVSVAVYAWLPALTQVWEILKVIYPLLILIYGLRMVGMIKASGIAIKVAAAAQMFFQRAALASGAAMGYQVTMSGLLRASMYSLRGAAVAAGAAMKAALLSMINPITLGITALMSLWMLYNKFKGELRTELEKMSDTFDEETFFTLGGDRYIDGLKRDLKSLRDEQKALDRDRAAGKKVTMEDYRKLADKRKQTQEFLTRAEAARGRIYGDDAGSFVSDATAAASSATSQVQRSIESNTKNMNIVNQLKMEINAPGGDSGAKTGLTAGQIAQLAEHAVKAQFNIQLKRVLVGAQ